MNDELFYQLALALVPNIGDVHARILLQQFGNATSIFKASLSQLERIEGIGMVRAKSITGFHDFKTAEAELKFLDQYKIRVLFQSDKEYPQRLLNCYDAPTLLFYKGEANLNASKVLSVVGTRSHTEYGKQFIEKFIRDLAGENILIVSGLAFGIDALAHKAALKNNLPTVGVVGHGLDKVYPYENTGLAKEMMKDGGGLLTEFFSGTKPDKHHFPLRNRIVAGMSDATVVVETHLRGGSMITGQLADSYHRDVFALPGRNTDTYSSGCNHLIQFNKAILLSDAAGLMETMGWKTRKKEKRKIPELFMDLSPEETKIVALLKEKNLLAIDEISIKCGLSSSSVAAAVLNLELNNRIASLPGKRFQLL